MQKYKRAKEYLQKDISALRNNVKDLKKQNKDKSEHIEDNMQRI